MMDNGAPEGSQCFYKGQHCKVKNNKVFVYRGGSWVFTKGISPSQIKKEVRRQRFEELLKPKKRKGINFDNS